MLCKYYARSSQVLRTLDCSRLPHFVQCGNMLFGLFHPMQDKRTIHPTLCVFGHGAVGVSYRCWCQI